MDSFAIANELLLLNLTCYPERVAERRRLADEELDLQRRGAGAFTGEVPPLGIGRQWLRVLEGEWTEATGNLAGMASECGNVSYISAKPDGTLIAGIALHGLWHSADGGDSWTQLGQGDGSDEILNRPSSIVYDPMDAER